MRPALRQAFPSHWTITLVTLLVTTALGWDDMLAALTAFCLYLAWRLRNRPAELARLAATLWALTTVWAATSHQEATTLALAGVGLALAAATTVTPSGRAWAVGAAATGAAPALAALADPVPGAIALIAYATATAWATSSGRCGAPMDALPAVACAYLTTLVDASDASGPAAWVMSTLPVAGAWATLMALAAVNLPEDTWQAARAAHSKETSHAH